MTSLTCSRGSKRLTTELRMDGNRSNLDFMVYQSTRKMFGGPFDPNLLSPDSGW